MIDKTSIQLDRKTMNLREEAIKKIDQLPDKADIVLCHIKINQIN